MELTPALFEDQQLGMVLGLLSLAVALALLIWAGARQPQQKER